MFAQILKYVDSIFAKERCETSGADVDSFCVHVDLNYNNAHNIYIYIYKRNIHIYVTE